MLETGKDPLRKIMLYHYMAYRTSFTWEKMEKYDGAAERPKN